MTDWVTLSVVLVMFVAIVSAIIAGMVYLGTPFSLGMGAGLALYHFSGWSE